MDRVGSRLALTAVFATALGALAVLTESTWRRVIVGLLVVVAVVSGWVLLLSLAPVQNVHRHVRAARAARRQRRRLWEARYAPLFVVHDPTAHANLFLDVNSVVRSDIYGARVRPTVGCVVRGGGGTWKNKAPLVIRPYGCGVTFPDDFRRVEGDGPPPAGARYASTWSIPWRGRAYSVSVVFHTDEDGRPRPGRVKSRMLTGRDQMRRVFGDDRDDGALYR